MARMHRTALALGLTLSLAPLAHAADLPDARALMDKHVAAIGGRDAVLRSVNGTAKMQMEIVENGMKADITTYSRGTDQATVMTLPGIGEFRSGYVGGVAWGMDPMNGPRLLQGAERQQAIQQTDPRYTLRDPAVIASATTVALADSEGRPCYRVEITWASGQKSADCYGKDDGLLLSTETSTSSPMGEIKQVAHLSEYREFNGLKAATVSKVLAAGMTQRITLLSSDPATPPPEAFALPAAIEALVKKAGTATPSTAQ